VNDNPYRPPRSSVVDVPSEEERIERPRHVFIAVALLWVTLVIQAAGLAFMWRLYRLMPPSFLIMAGVITCVWVLTAWVAAMLERGRNWARFVYLVLLLVNAPLALILTAFTASAAPIAALAMPVQLLLQIAAMIMLFVPPAGAWFRGEAAE
jgi:predicted permease